MRIFVIGFAHTQTIDPRDEDLVNVCPFTEQLWYFAKMMVDRGHEVIHIGMPGSVVPAGVEHVDGASEEVWRVLYGSRGPLEPFILSIDHAYGKHWHDFAAKVHEIILARGGEPYSSIVATLCPYEPAIKDLPQIVVEVGIGYPKAVSPFRVYLSNAWRHFHEGLEGNWGGDKWYRQVIPLGLNLDLFGPVVPTRDKQDFFLVQTRMLEPKGVRIAVQVARELQTPIILTGRGDASSFVAEWPQGAKYAGISSLKVRRELMRSAKALLSPTRYVEPLGAVALEAMASGCPVISSDFGGFTETVVHGYTGWRCNTFDEYVWAARNADRIDPFTCRAWVERNHNFERVGAAYEEYFESLLRLRAGKLKAGADWLDAGPATERKMLGRAFRDYSMFYDGPHEPPVEIRQDIKPGENPEAGIYHHLRG